MTICNYIVTDRDNEYLPDQSYVAIQKNELNEKILNHNIETDIIGICGAGKYLTKYDYPLREHYIKKVFENYDVIIPFSSEIKGENIEMLLKEKEADLTDYLSGFSTVYMDCYRRITGQKRIALSDVFIAKTNIFYDIYDFINGSKYSDMPLVRDILFRIYIMAHEPALRIREEQYTAKNPDEYENAIKKIELTYKYISLIEQDYVAYRKREGFTDPFIEEIDCEDDFDNKIPVFVCWWQGENDIPEMVRACINSIKRNLPLDKTAFRLITLENVGKYVTFNAAIIEKFNEGKISYSHLSDVLRTELLYRYGGLWIDATYYVSHPFPKEFFSQDYFSIAFENPEFGPDISGVKWSTSIWYTRPKNEFMQFLTECKWVYWEKQDTAVDYFIFDYEVELAYREFPKFRDMIDSCVKSSPAVYDLQLKMNQRYTLTEKNSLTKDSLFYKLNRRYEYKKETGSGDVTVYGAVCGEKDESLSIKNTRTIVFDSPEELISKGFEMIREFNPDKILDRSYVFPKAGLVSRAYLDSLIFHPLIIDGVSDATSFVVLPSDAGIYNAIYDKSDDFDDSGYDMIIELKND